MPGACNSRSTLDGVRSAWLTEVARALVIPFALEAPFQGPEELAEALAAGAGRVVVPASAPTGPPGVELIRADTVAEAVGSGRAEWL